MPELPEVEHAVRRLRPAVVGRRVAAVTARHATARRALPDDTAATLLGRQITAVERRGKHQFLLLDDGRALHAHFRMNGDWKVTPAAAEPPRHTRITVALDDAMAVHLVDARALATITVRASGHDDPSLGPDATDPSFDESALAAGLRGRRAAIKPTLLDQRVVAGVGNIYAAEALWRAAIDPRVPAAKLGPARRGRLVDAVRATMADALADAGRYQDGDALDRLAVYDREGQPCRRCAAPIRRIVQAGRSTYFCGACQRR